METISPLSRETLDEDMQIMRFTLAAISEDVRRFSDRSADALEDAIESLAVAHKEFARAHD